MDAGDARQALISLRDELEARVERTHKHIHGREEPVSTNFGDQSVEMENQQLVVQLDEEGRDELRQIQKALTRLEDGTYGLCAECGRKISPARLDIIPYAAECISCAD